MSGSEDEFHFPEDGFDFDDDSDRLFPNGDSDRTELEEALDRAAEALEENEQYTDDFRDITEAIADGRIGVENVVEGLENSNDEHRINFARYINATNYFLHQTEDEINEMQGTLSNIENTVDELSRLDIPDDYAREDTLEDLRDDLDDIDSSTNNYILDVDWSGIENIVKYVGGGLKNIVVGGGRKAEETVDDVGRRKVLAGAGLLVAGDYFNVIHGDKGCGDALYRTKETGWDFDFWGAYGEQERCNPNGAGNGGAEDETDPVDDVQTPYERDVELSDEDLQYAIDNTEGTDQELSNIKNIDGNLNDFGYDSESDEFYVEVEDGNEETRVEISEEAYWNAVDN